jgi:hypothetical protein
LKLEFKNVQSISATDYTEVLPESKTFTEWRNSV